MAYENLLIETLDPGIGVITLNRPASLNALSNALMRELDDALAAFDQDDAIRCIVLTGAGEKAFSAGADIHDLAEGFEETFRSYQWPHATLKKPTIAAVNGLAFGGAALLATEMDIRIGCERSKFRFVYTSIGRIGASWTLPLIVGWPRAKELLFTARMVEPEEALQIGLLNQLVPSAELLGTALNMARQICGNKPDAVQGVKRLLGEQIGRGWRQMLDAEQEFRSSVPHLSPTEAFKDFFERTGREGGGA